MMRNDICVAAIADCFRGEADILCNPIGISPIIGGRLAKATFSPDVVMTDAVSVLATNPLPLNDPDAERTVESYVPYRTIFDIVWSGRRHVMMGATQIDQYGNQNIAAIGDYKAKSTAIRIAGITRKFNQPPDQLLGAETLTKKFVSEVDIVSGPGYDRMRLLDSQEIDFTMFTG